MTTFNHLAPDTQTLLELSNDQRANHMLLDRFIIHDRLQPIVDYIEFLRFSAPQSRAGGLVVSGRYGAGKTMLAKATLRRYPQEGASASAASSRPVLAISMTDAREAKTLHNRMLEALNCPLSAHVTGSDRERLVLKLCRAAGVKMLIVDEIQDILTSTPRQQRLALDTIKFLMNELTLPILVLGTPEAKTAMEVDEHLNARFAYRELPHWKADALLGKFLDALELRLPLKQRSCLSSPTLMTQLISVSGGMLNNIVKTTCHAAAHAVEQGIERVTVALIDLASHTPPPAVARLAKEKMAIERMPFRAIA